MRFRLWLWSHVLIAFHYETCNDLSVTRSLMWGDVIECLRKVLHDCGINNSDTFVLFYLLAAEIMVFNS